MRSCFYIQKEMHEVVGPEYPASKFLVIMEEFTEHNKKEKEAVKHGK